MRARRLVLGRAGIVVIFALLVTRLWQVQITHGREYRRASEENRIRLVRREAPRGVIYDRRGRILATSRLCLDIVVTPQAISDDPPAIAQLAAIVGKPRALVAAALRRGQGPFAGVVLASDVPLEVATRAAEAALHLPGLHLQARPVRSYPFGSLAAHVLGYVRDIDAAELALMRAGGYTPHHRIGKDGVERVREAALRGADGGEQVEVDACGNLVRVLGEVAPMPGDAIVLSLDADV